MKELLDSKKYPSLLDVSLSVSKSVTTAIVPLQPQEEKIMNGLQHLAAQAQRINQIAEELEAAILELKAMSYDQPLHVYASTVKGQKRHLLVKDEPFQSVCKNFAINVPYVRQQPDKSFILTMRKVDLFRAEREAALLAQTLRQKSKRKQLASQEQKTTRVGRIITQGAFYSNPI